MSTDVNDEVNVFLLTVGTQWHIYNRGLIEQASHGEPLSRIWLTH